MPLHITFKSKEIHNFLRVDIDQDEDLIESLKMAAMEEAHIYLNTDFSTITSNGDGTTSTTAIEAPGAVKLWVLNRITQLYENRGVSVDPDFTSISRFKKINFGGFRNLNEPIRVTEWDIVNGADDYERQ